jgi:dTDP-4-amino-4,6-dideoxygalactose transaminase
MVENENIHSKWMYGIRIFDRKESFEVKQAFFNSRGIDIRPMFYTIGNHKHLINNKDVMICNDKFGEDISKSTIMLPSYPELTKEDLSLIVSCVNDFVM